MLLIIVSFVIIEMKSVIGQCYIDCENVDDDIAEIIESMDDLAYSVMTGFFQLYDADTSDIYIPFAKPDTNYLISYFESSQSNSIRLGGRDAIVWRGCTPQQVIHFNYRSYKMKKILNQNGAETYFQSSLGDSINDLVINTESNDQTTFSAPYDRKTNIITTADGQTWTDVVTSYENSGLLTEYSVNLDAINSSNTFTYSSSELDYPRDEIVLIYEIAFDPDSPCEKESYLNQSFPFWIFYDSSNEIEPRSPFNLPSRDTSVDTQDCEVDTVQYWEDAVTELASVIKDGYGYYLISDTEFTDNTGTVSNGDNLGIFQHGSYCMDNSVDCMFDNPDTYYSWDQQEHTLEDDDLYLLIGLNHDHFGLSTTNSLSIARVTNPDNGNEFDIIDSEYGTGQVWVAQITRPENCLNSNDYPYAMCLDRNTLGPDDNFIFFAEATLNPSTMTRPDPDCLINWRLLHFKTTPPTQDPTADPTADPSWEPTPIPTPSPTSSQLVFSSTTPILSTVSSLP